MLKAPWRPGQSGNPAGRPKSARNKLGEAFIVALFDDWKENGVEAIRLARERDPVGYIKTVASILPKDINLRSDDYSELSDDELGAQLVAVVEQLAGGHGEAFRLLVAALTKGDGRPN